MRINKKLNIVIPMTTEKQGKIFIHSIPISRDVFETFYAELGKVFNQCLESGNTTHFILSAPQLAYAALKRISMDAGKWDGNSGVKFGLVNEIIRLTSVMINNEHGWSSLPLDTIIKRGELLDEDEESEVLSALIFFTSISLVAPKQLRTDFLEMAGSTRGWELTSLDFTAFMNGLPKSMKEETTDSKAKV